MHDFERAMFNSARLSHSTSLQKFKRPCSSDVGEAVFTRPRSMRVDETEAARQLRIRPRQGSQITMHMY